MKSLNHHSAPHICVYPEGTPFVKICEDLGKSIATAAKRSLVPVDRGIFNRNAKVKVSFPDMDSTSYTISVELPAEFCKLDYGLLKNIRSLKQKINDNLSHLHLMLSDEEPSYQNGWITWVIIPTPAACYRVSFLAAQESYKKMCDQASTCFDGGGLADELANTEEPTIQNLLDSHFKFCSELLRSAENLSEWKERKFEYTPFDSFFNQSNTSSTTLTGTVTIEEQVSSHKKAFERAIWQLEKLQALATL